MRSNQLSYRAIVFAGTKIDILFIQPSPGGLFFVFLEGGKVAGQGEESL